MVFFHVYTAAAHLNLRIYPLVDRVTYYVNFQAYATTQELADHVILVSLLVVWLFCSLVHKKTRYASMAAAGLAVVAGSILYSAIQTGESSQLLDVVALLSLPVASGLMLYNKYSAKKVLKNQNYDLVVRYGALVGIAAGAMTLAYSLVPITTGSDLTSVPVRSFAHDIFLVMAAVSPALMILLIACFPVKILINTIARAVPKPVEEGQGRGSLSEMMRRDGSRIGREKRIVFLSLIVGLSILIAITPHLGTVNPDGQRVGVDTGFYVNWVRALDNASNSREFFNEAFILQAQGDRPFSLIIILALWKVAEYAAGTAADLFLVVEFLPLILAPALAIVVYFLARELTRNDFVSLTAAFLTVVSYHALIGVYAGFYANWLALIFGYLSLLFLFRYLKGGGRANFAFFTGLMLVTLFTHVYTWSILAIASGVFLVVAAAKNYGVISGGVRKYAIVLLIGLMATVVVDLAKATLTGTSGGVGEDLEIAGNLAGPEQFVSRWNNLTYTVTTFVGGIFANFILIGLTLYWLVRNRMSEMTTAFLMIFLSVGLLPFLFGEWVIQTRVFYNIPFQIPAAIALFWVTRRSGTMIVPAAVFLWLVTIALLIASNFYFVAPTAPPEEVGRLP